MIHKFHDIQFAHGDYFNFSDILIVYLVLASQIDENAVNIWIEEQMVAI